MGAHLVRELLSRGDEVVALDDLSGGFADNVDPGARFVEASIADAEAIDGLFAEQSFDRVYHLAAYAAEGLSHFIKRFNYTNNVLGSVTLINAAVNHGVDCFVFTSSIAVYGSGQTPMSEEMIPQPEDSYGIAKRAVELELHASREMFDLDFVVFRPHNVYGELQNIGDRYRNVLGIFVNQIMRGEPLSIFGDGTQTRAFSYVGDVIGPIAAAPDVAGARGETFNVGADQPWSVNELARLICAEMGVPDHPVRAPRGAQRGPARLLRPLEAGRGLRGAGPASASRGDRPYVRVGARAWARGRRRRSRASRSRRTCPRAGVSRRRRRE